MRWLYHLLPRQDLPTGIAPCTPDPAAHYAPESLAREGFIHASYAESVAESARLYFAPGSDLVALRIDPRRLDHPLTVASTPRGPMPHLHGPLPLSAIRAVHEAPDWQKLDDRVRGHRIAFLAFPGMTLLDLVGPLDALSRLRTMDFDPEVVTDVLGVLGTSGAEVSAILDGPEGLPIVPRSGRPPLGEYDLVVVPGGRGTLHLLDDPEVRSWLLARPAHHLWASVCTGSIVLAELGLLDGRAATTHHRSFERLAAHPRVRVIHERVVRDGPVYTAAGVTSGIDLGLALIAHLEDPETVQAIATQMEWPMDARSMV
jgi:cyclohexyl-isocyanide hydratase